MLNSLFTIVIPTHDRHDCLDRSIKYFSDSSIEIIYCDSTETEYKGKIPENITYYNNPKLKFSEKILFCLTKVKTPLVALSADDDFLEIESLIKGSEFLNNNLDYVSVTGEFLFFLKPFDNLFYKNKKKPFESIVSKYPFERAYLFFDNYFQILWGLYRVDILKKSFEVINAEKPENDNFIELTLGSILCFHGKIYYSNDIWGFREVNLENTWGLRHKPINFINFILDSKLKSQVKLFENYIDKYSSKGFGRTVIKSYLNLSFIKQAYSLLKKIFAYFVFIMLRYSAKDRFLYYQSERIRGSSMNPKIHELIK